MKTVLAILSILLMVGFALAQNTATLTQQTGAADIAAITQLTGTNTIDFTQTGGGNQFYNIQTNAGTADLLGSQTAHPALTNYVQFEQYTTGTEKMQLTQSAPFGSNALYGYQIGAGSNLAFVNQTANQVYNNAWIYQNAASSNYVDLKQEAQYHNNANVFQSGVGGGPGTSNNFVEHAKLATVGGWTVPTQYDGGNPAFMSATGPTGSNELDIDQLLGNNKIGLDIRGLDNYAKFWQNGAAAFEADVIQKSTGGNNWLSVNQENAGNKTALLLQDGAGNNTATIVQH